MTIFGSAKRLAILALLPLLTTGHTWAGEFHDKVERIFSSSVIDSINESGSSGEVIFKTPERTPDYFYTGDKLGKLFAIDSARVFREVEGIERLTLRVPANGKQYTMSVTRNEIEQYYGANFAEMKENLEAWRSEFIQKYDTNSSRAAFVKSFVIEQ